MTVLVFEDNDVKWKAIEAALIEKGLKHSSIIRIDNVAKFTSVRDRVIDFCIIDIRMPGVSGGLDRNTGTEILSMIEYSGINVPCMAITEFPNETASLVDDFAARGCIIYDYNKRDQWLQALDIYLAMSKEIGRYDFLIFTALKKERDGFLADTSLVFDSSRRNGLDITEFELAGKLGGIVLLPRMGLVNATAVVAKALENYSPRVVAMSGICAGVGDNAKLGQLLVTDFCWEYQSGKWLDDAFEADPYQVSTPQRTRDILSQITSDSELLATLEQFHKGAHRPSERAAPKLAVFTSGSAVIASDKRLDSVRQQHRKVAGLDMEIFGFHRAVELSGLGIHVLSAKVVVDKADEAKGDLLHDYGCVVSAAFILRAIRELLQ